MTKGKLVRYNGGTASLHYCSEPQNLKSGETYTLLEEKVEDSQTNYILLGIEGEYNSAWFDNVPFTYAYLAQSNSFPIIGESMYLRKFSDYQWQLVSTSLVRNYRIISENMYEVHTSNTIYIVQIV